MCGDIWYRARLDTVRLLTLMPSLWYTTDCVKPDREIRAIKMGAVLQADVMWNGHVGDNVRTRPWFVNRRPMGILYSWCSLCILKELWCSLTEGERDQIPCPDPPGPYSFSKVNLKFEIRIWTGAVLVTPVSGDGAKSFLSPLSPSFVIFQMYTCILGIPSPSSESVLLARVTDQ